MRIRSAAVLLASVTALVQCGRAPEKQPARNGAAGSGGEGSAGLGGGIAGTNQPLSGSGGLGGSGGEAGCTDVPIDASGCTHPEVRADCKDGWCRIPAGCFVMGAAPCQWARALVSENEMLVTLTHAFEIQQYEVTQAQWTALGLPNPSGANEHGRSCLEPECPVGNVSWTEALAFANMLSERHDPPLEPCYELTDCTGEIGRDFSCKQQSQRGDSVYECKGYRLPTKAEWEYAARAGARTAFYNGDIAPQAGLGVCGPDPLLEQIAWYCYNSGGTTHPVGGKLPNGFGLFDVLGNAAEWTTGKATEPIRPAEAVDYEPTLPEQLLRPARGGWAYAMNATMSLARWHNGRPDDRAPGFGFRLVRTVE